MEDAEMHELLEPAAAGKRNQSAKCPSNHVVSSHPERSNGGGDHQALQLRFGELGHATVVPPLNVRNRYRGWGK